MIIDGDEIIAIIEVKRLCNANSTKTQLQLAAYSYFSDNTPVFLLTHKNDIHRIIAKIQKIRKERKKAKG